MKLAKKIIIALIVFCIFCLGAAGGFVYLNKVFLPSKIKAMIIQGLSDATGRDVRLGALKFSLFKGLVLENIQIGDDAQPLVKVKGVYCSFLIWPVFNKKIIIPSILIDKPEVFLLRKADNTFPLVEMFRPKAQAEKNQEWNVVIGGVNVKDGRIKFRDEGVTPVFTKTIEGLDARAALSLPSKIKFKLEANVPGGELLRVSCEGEYQITDKSFSGSLMLKNFQPAEFAGYFKPAGVNVSAGTIDLACKELAYKNNVLAVALEAQSKGLVLTKDALEFKVDAVLNAWLRYNLIDKQAEYSGRISVAKAQAQGLPQVESITGVKGDFEFSNEGIRTDKLNATILGVPVEAKVKLVDFAKPDIDALVSSQLSLIALVDILRQKFAINLPVDANGSVNVVCSFKGQAPFTGGLIFNGKAKLINAGLRFTNPQVALEKVNGDFEFSQKFLQWSNLRFSCQDAVYLSSGSITDFTAPVFEGEVSSDNLSVKAKGLFQNAVLTIASCKGGYFNSQFSLQGLVNLARPEEPVADVKGELSIDLKDLKELLKKNQEQLTAIKPEGKIKVNLSLGGKVKDIPSCVIDLSATSSLIKAYGFRFDNFALTYNQGQGTGNLRQLHVDVYGGSADAAGSIDLTAKSLSYALNAVLQGVKIEKVKLDTSAKDKDISGILSARGQLNGSISDAGALNGFGTILINEGKLWQLNLFKGIGPFIFSKDFANIVFSQAGCSFNVQDKAVVSNDILMKSNIVDLDGNARVGFDSSLDAALNVHVLDESVPLTGTIKDLTTAIIGQAVKFGSIRITGTLKEPRYNFTASVGDILGGLKNTLFGRSQQ